MTCEGLELQLWAFCFRLQFCRHTPLWCLLMLLEGENVTRPIALSRQSTHAPANSVCDSPIAVEAQLRIATILRPFELRMDLREFAFQKFCKALPRLAINSDN